MLLEYHMIYQFGAVAASVITVKILTQPKARPIDLFSAAIMFTELDLILAGTIRPGIKGARV